MNQNIGPEGAPPSTSSGSTRREALAHSGLLFAAGALGGFAGIDPALAAEASQSGQPAASAADASLYGRLGGIFAIAAVVNHFSDEIIRDPVAGAGSANPALRRWHTEQLDRLPGLKFMRTLWVANVSGGPFQYTPTRPGATNVGLEAAHASLHISPAEFDAVAAVLTRSLDHFLVPAREKQEVLAAFAAHKEEVTKGSRDARPGN
ncbi:MAG: group I truncated hemoglobin [Allosphingosinicella sp.]